MDLLEFVDVALQFNVRSVRLVGWYIDRFEVERGGNRIICLRIEWHTQLRHFLENILRMHEEQN